MASFLAITNANWERRRGCRFPGLPQSHSQFAGPSSQIAKGLSVLNDRAFSSAVGLLDYGELTGEPLGLPRLGRHARPILPQLLQFRVPKAFDNLRCLIHLRDSHVDGQIRKNLA